MTEWTSTPQFEKNVSQSFQIPEIRSEFVEQVHLELLRRAEAKTRKPRLVLGLRPAWAVSLAILFFLLIGTLAIGPQRVYAAVLHLLGYIPGVGIIDQENPIRVLADPVSVTKDGISITVTSATLTGDRTHIDYRIFGVPGFAYPAGEDVSGCTRQPYLLLPDGTQLVQENEFPAIPAGINDAVLWIPCIFNTLPGSVPENWELPLHFVPALPNLTVVPVIESLPSPSPSLISSTSIPENQPAAVEASTPNAESHSLRVTKVLDIGDRFVLMGEFNYDASRDSSLPAGSWWVLQQVSITGADGQSVPQMYSNDFELPTPSQPNAETWLYEIAKNFIPPVTILYTGEIISPVGALEQAEFEFDAGANPQTGGEWQINQDFKLGGYNIHLVSIEAGAQGYSFQFKADPGASANLIRVEIVGYTPNCGGGGGGDQFPEEFSREVCYAGFAGSPEFPRGNLKAILYFQSLKRTNQTFQVQWSPDATQTGAFASSTPQPGVCLNTTSLAQLSPAPAALSGGTALLYEKLSDSDQWGLVLYGLDGSRKDVMASNGNWGSLSPDGLQVAYSALDNGIHIFDSTTHIDRSLTGAAGFDVHWSPDGKQLAYIGSSGVTINSVFIVNTDGTQLRQVSDWSYEAVIGWQPDGNQLYFVAPFTGGAAWKVYAFDLPTGQAIERFTIENGTPKFLNAKLSPDGKWIAYRGRDNSSVYLVRTDGSDMRLVVDNLGAVGIAWSRSGWLGASLRQPNSDESTLVIINPEGCEAYRLPPALHGDLQGLNIP